MTNLGDGGRLGIDPPQCCKGILSKCRSAAFRLSRLRVLRMSDGSRQPRRACSTAYRMKRSLPGAVRIGRQHKLHADLLGELAMPFVEIEAVRLPPQEVCHCTAATWTCGFGL